MGALRSVIRNVSESIWKNIVSESVFATLEFLYGFLNVPMRFVLYKKLHLETTRYMVYATLGHLEGVSNMPNSSMKYLLL